MVVSSRTPEGEPGRCPVCGSAARLEPSLDTRDVPCPCCGHLLWLRRPLGRDPAEQQRLAGQEARLAVGRLFEAGTRRLGPPDRSTAAVLSAIRDAEVAEALERLVGKSRSWDELFCLAWDCEAGSAAAVG